MRQNLQRMLLKILIGTVRGKQGSGENGIDHFIQFLLPYPSLEIRFAVFGIPLIVAWLLWNPFVMKLCLIPAAIYASLIIIRLLSYVSQATHFGRIVAAMWLPIGVSGVAAYLFFMNDQGGELGIGLMDLNLKGVFLGFILVYWAFNNWLSARIGLDRAFPEPKKELFLLFWGPRLVGVLAHLLAACSLTNAARSHVDMQGWFEQVLAWAAPVAIVLSTVFVWLLDHAHISKRSREDRKPITKKLMWLAGSIELVVFLFLTYESLFRKVPPGFVIGTICISVSAILFLGIISYLRKKAPIETSSGKEREQDVQEEQKKTRRYAGILTGFVIISTGVIWYSPMYVGEIFGSLNIACFSFGSFLALANLLDLCVSGLRKYAKEAGFAFSSHAVRAIFLCLLVLPAIGTSLTQSFHRVRLCEKKCTSAPKPADWSAVEIPAKRPTVSEAARAWYAQAEPAYHSIHPGKPVPMLIVATAGGGIRAAYWTATILEKLENDLRREASIGASGARIPPVSLMRNLLFAISGVSGGSVGAAAYTASVQAYEFNEAPIKPTNYLKEDFLAPGLASMIFVDGLSNVVPDFGQIDRGQALELGFEYASRIEGDKDGSVSHKFLSFFPDLGNPAKPNSWRPALLLNATHQKTGRRIIASHIKIERNVFFDSYDALQVLGDDVRLSTAAHNSARFTYISPAGSLISATEPSHNRGYVIDGGYFENYGARTALELARNAIEAIDPKRENKVKLVILQISSDPTLKQDRTLVRAQSGDRGACVVSSLQPAARSDGADKANYLELIDRVGRTDNEGEGFVLSSVNELSAPLVGIMSVRQAHGTIAAAELAASICRGENKVEEALKDPMERKTSDAADVKRTVASVQNDDAPHFSHMAMCEVSSKNEAGINPPLGWVLSDSTRSRFKDILGDCGNDQQLTDLEKALDPSFPAASGITINERNDGAR